MAASFNTGKWKEYKGMGMVCTPTNIEVEATAIALGSSATLVLPVIALSIDWVF